MKNMTSLSKAIQATLAYSDIFDFPLERHELYRLLIGFRISKDRFRAELEELLAAGPLEDKGVCVGQKKGYLFLAGREQIVAKRLEQEKIAQKKIKLAYKKTSILRLVPWIKLVAVTGRVAAGSAQFGDDIDLLIVTAPNRLWLSRFSEFVLLTLTRQRRHPNQTKNLDNKLCPNMYLTEENLVLLSKDLFSANELARVKVVWERKGVYQKLIEANGWVREYLPNWKPQNREITNHKSQAPGKSQISSSRQRSRGFAVMNLILDPLEAWARFIQLKYMQDKRTREIVNNNLLMFHPNNTRERIMKEYQSKLGQLKIDET